MEQSKSNGDQGVDLSETMDELKTELAALVSAVEKKEDPSTRESIRATLVKMRREAKKGSDSNNAERSYGWAGGAMTYGWAG
ncbi:MAG: hypothetical protein ABIH35_00065 [Patescibacteria group bacterium]